MFVTLTPGFKLSPILKFKYNIAQGFYFGFGVSTLGFDASLVWNLPFPARSKPGLSRDHGVFVGADVL